MKKILCLFLIAVLLVGVCACTTPAQTEPTDTAACFDGELTADYQRCYAADCADAFQTDAQMTTDAQAGAVVFSAAEGTEILLDKTFCFDSLPVSRFSFGAAAEDGADVTLAFYLDEEAEPFVTAALSPRKSDAEVEGLLAGGLLFKNHTEDISARGLTGEHRLRITVENASAGASFSLCYVEFVGSTVPTIYLDIDESQGTIAEMNGSEDHSAKCHGEMRLQIPDGYVSEYTDETFESSTYALDYLRGRGSSTWGYTKKPYKIKLEDGADLLGMGKAKEWALIANYCDNSLLRNKITYWLGEQCGLQYTPQSEPVDVVLGGEYIGSYMLSETVQVKDSRVAIDDLEDAPDIIDGDEITGGYLISLAARPGDDEGQASFYTDNYRFFLENPSFEDGIVDAQMAYISNYVNQVERAIFDGTWQTDDGISVEELLDFRSAAVYYLLQAFSANSDAFITDSTYLYKARNGKLYFGPLWDFDYTTWGETNYAGWETYGYFAVDDAADCGEYGNLVATTGGSEEKLWIGALFGNDAFVQEFASAWNDMKTAMETLVADGGQLDFYRERMKTTGFYNFEAIGPSQIAGIDPNGCFESDKVTLTWEQEVARLKDWMTKVLPACEEHVQMLIPVKVDLKVIDGIDGSELFTLGGVVYDPLPTMPDAPEKDGYVFLGYVSCLLMDYDEAIDFGYLDAAALTDEEIAAYQTDGYLVERDLSRTNLVEEGMYLKAVYISLADYVPVTELYFVHEHYQEAPFAADEELRVVALPENATLVLAGKLVCTSSNEDAVYYVGDGMFYCSMPGEATVTAQADGLTATATVTVTEEQTP